MSSEELRTGRWPALNFMMGYRTWPKYLYNKTFIMLNARNLKNDTAVGLNFGYDLDFKQGDLLHVGISWDEAWGDTHIRLYINDKLMTPVYTGADKPRSHIIGTIQELLPSFTYDLELCRRSRRPDGASSQYDSDDRVDNLKIWNFSKTDFSDRFDD